MSTRLTPGALIGPYEIQSALGSGGMGEVYKARDTRLNRTVAIKVLAQDPRETASARERFAQEARALSQLNHPHVCTLFDVGEQTPASPSGEPLRYLVMEFVDGETLSARLERGALPLEQALAFAIQIADALDKVHRAGIVHGDLKPGNVMVTKTGIKLLDFGLARQQRQAPPSGWSDAVTQPIAAPATEGLVGTLQYFAPEQLEGRDSDERSDIFALGAVIYEMVTGRKAFAGDSPAAVMAAIMTQQPPLLAATQPASPAALEHVVAGCLAKDPSERWQHAGDLTRQLKWIASGTPPVAQDGVRARCGVSVDDRRSRSAPGRRRRTVAGLPAASGCAPNTGIPHVCPFAGGPPVSRRRRTWRHRALRHFAERSAAGLCRNRCQRQPDAMAAAARVARRVDVAGHRRRLVSVLVTRFTPHRVRGARAAEDRRPGWRLSCRGGVAGYRNLWRME